MRRLLFTLTFLAFSFGLCAQLKISQYPNTNALGPNQLFLVTAGGTNMNVKTSDMPGALGVPTLAVLYSVGANVTGLVYTVGANNTNFSLGIGAAGTNNVNAKSNFPSGLSADNVVVTNNMNVNGTLSMGTFNVNTIVVTTSVAAASASFTNLVSTNASFGTLRGLLSVSNAANSQRHSYVDDGEGWQFFYGGDQWTFDPAASTGVPHRSEITANTNFANASIGNGVVTNTIGYFYSVSNAWDATNFLVDVTSTLYIQSSNLVGLTNFANTETGNGTKIIYQNIIVAGVSNTPGEIRWPTNAQFGYKFRWMGTKPTHATNDASTWFSIAWRGTNATVAGATATGQ